MKKLILSAAILLSIAATAATPNEYPENEKVAKTFKEEFKGASEPKWSVVGKYYEAFFYNGEIKTRAKFDNDGNLVQTIRYYSADVLPATVSHQIKKTYPGKEIFGVTEVTNHNGVNYRIVLKDDKNYTHINANDQGDSEIVSKYKRGDK